MNYDITYVDQINDLNIKNLIITKVVNKKHQYNVECCVENVFCCFYFNSKLKKTTSCSLSKYNDRRLFPNLGDNFIYIVNQRINKEVDYKLKLT